MQVGMPGGLGIIPTGIIAVPGLWGAASWIQSIVGMGPGELQSHGLHQPLFLRESRGV